MPAFDENHIGGVYSLMEIEIIRLMASAHLFSGQKERALEVLLALRQVLEASYLARSHRADMVASLMVTTAKAHRHLGQPQKAHEASCEGLVLCAETQSGRLVPWLLYQKAAALELLAQRQAAIESLQDAITMFRYQGESGMLAFCQGRLAEMAGVRQEVKKEP